MSESTLAAIESALEDALSSVEDVEGLPASTIIKRIGETLLGASLPQIKAAIKAEIKQELSDTVRAAVRAALLGGAAGDEEDDVHLLTAAA